MKRFNLMDTTFIIPVKSDSSYRIKNMKLVISYIFHNFKTNILVVEEDSVSKCDFVMKLGCKYHFEYTNKHYFYATKIRNIGVRLSNTPIIVNYDTDIIFPEHRYIDSVRKIRKEKYDMVYPFGGQWINFRESYFNIINDKLKNGFKKSIKGLSLDVFCRHGSVGGCVFFNRQSFIDGGMENENFKSWGKDDKERYMRFSKLGYKIHRLDGPIYHLYHPLSSKTARKLRDINTKQFKELDSMSSKELRVHVDKWEWLKKG